MNQEFEQRQQLRQQLNLIVRQLHELSVGSDLAADPDWRLLAAELQQPGHQPADNSYQIFFEKAKTPQLLIEPQSGGIVQANPAAALFYGYSQQQLQAMKITEINCLTPQQIHLEMNKAVAEQRCYFQFPHRLANGDIRQVEVHCGPVIIDGQPLLYSIIYDLTERLTTEAQLRAKRQRLQNILSGTQAGTWEWCLASDEILINAYWAQMLGYENHELEPVTRQTLQRLMHPEDWLHADAILQAHIAGRLPNVECELRLQHRLGHWVWVLCRGQIMTRDRDGAPLQMAGTHLDISARKTAELALRDSELRYRALHDSLPVGCVMLDQGCSILAVNQEACRIFGLSPEAFIGSTLSGANWQRLQEDGRPLSLDEHPVCRCLASGHPIRDAIMGVQRGQEAIIWLRVNCQPLFHPDDLRPYAVISTLQDITAQRRDEEALRLAASVLTAAREAILITNTEGCIVQVNQAFCDMTGYTADEVMGRNPKLLQSGYQDAEFYRSFWHSLHSRGHWSGEMWNRRKNGEIFAEQLTISVVTDEHGTPRHYVCLASDISDKKQYQHQLEQQAYHDLLTGLPNRKLLFDKLPELMARCYPETSQRLVVAYIDLDGFKQINDAHGHSIGDQLLIAITRRMRMTLREQDLIARIGGDEFIGVIHGSGNRQDLVRLIKRLLRVIARPVVIADLRLRVSASIGLATYPQTGSVSCERLIQQADEAMYRVKQQGKNGYLLMDDEAR